MSENVRIFKHILSQMHSKLDSALVIHFLLMDFNKESRHEYTTYEGVLKKALWVESNTDCMISSVDRRL